jgi:hypothetical protein
MDAQITPGTTVANFDLVEFYPSLDTSAVDCFFDFEMGTRLIQICTGETDTSKLLDSNIFGRTDSEFQTYPSNGALAYIATTSTKKLRNFPDATITLNFKDWFKSRDRMDNLAMWFDKANDRFRIEEKEQVYKDELIYDFGVVSNLKVRPYKGGYWSQLMTGTNEKGDYEKVSGAQEYNIKSEHSIDFPVKDKLDLRVPYNTDSRTMDFSRISRYENQGSTDTKEDNKIVIVKTDGTETIVNGSDYGDFLGIDEMYNIDYSPRNCILNNGNWIGSVFEKDDNGVIKFRNNSKDIDFTKVNSPNEQADIEKSELGTPLYFPEEFEFDFQINDEGIKAIEADPHGYYRGETQDGKEFFVYSNADFQINDFKGIGKGTFLKANKDR